MATPLSKLYAKLGHLRATRDSAEAGRKEVYAAEVKSVVAQINKLKATTTPGNR